MLNKIRISTGLVIVILIYIILQLLSTGSLFYITKYSKNSMDKIDTLIKEQHMVTLTITNVNVAKFAFLKAADAIHSPIRIDDVNVVYYVQEGMNNLEIAEKNMDNYLDIIPISEEDKSYAEDINEAFRVLRPLLRNAGNALAREDVDEYVKMTRDSSPLFLALNEYYEKSDGYSSFLSTQTKYFLNQQGRFGIISAWASSIMFVILLVLSISAYSWTKRNIFMALKEINKNITSISSGDLTHNIVVTSDNEIGQVMSDLQKMRNGLIRIVSTIREKSSSISESASELVAGNDDLSSRTEAQAAALEETAASMEELTSTVKQNVENTNHVNGIANKSSELAKQGGIQIGKVN